MNRTHRDFTPSSSNPFEDPKLRFRHHSLMQDYQELHMETEANRKRLQKMRERKAKLVAEVRFLRRRYIHLSQDQAVMQPAEMKKAKGGSNSRKKSKTQIRMEESPNKSSEVETKHVSLPDLNHSGKCQDDTKSTNLEKKVPMFDLNQISGEEEEEAEAVNNEHERTRMEEGSSSKRTSSNMEMQQQKDLKLSSCRNGGNGSHKRKISWQDPVAPLRV